MNDQQYRKRRLLKIELKFLTSVSSSKFMGSFCSTTGSRGLLFLILGQLVIVSISNCVNGHVLGGLSYIDSEEC